MPRSPSGALALIPETSIFTEWLVLLLDRAGGGVCSGTQEEVVFRAGDCRLGFRSTPPCTPEHLPFIGKVWRSTQKESACKCSRPRGDSETLRGGHFLLQGGQERRGGFCLLGSGTSLVSRKHLRPHLSHPSNRVVKGGGGFTPNTKVSALEATSLKGHPNLPISTPRELLGNILPMGGQQSLQVTTAWASEPAGPPESSSFIGG